jgi:hypothetical protein
MSNKRLVEVNMFSKLWDLFLNAKEKNKEQEFIKKMMKTDPELGKIYHNWNSKMDNTLRAIKNSKDKKGMDTTKIKNLLKKQY